MWWSTSAGVRRSSGSRPAWTSSRTASACSADYYRPEGEGGFAYNDPDVAIVSPAELQLLASARDRGAPTVAESLPFIYPARDIRQRPRAAGKVSRMISVSRPMPAASENPGSRRLTPASAIL
jgi:hypothetical protein